MARRLPVAESATNDIRAGSLQAVGAAVRNARARAQMRIDDAAAFCGVSVDVLSRLENGKSVTTDRLLKVLNGLGLEMLVAQREQVQALSDRLREGAE